MSNAKPSFESQIPIIQGLLNRKRSKWTLNCVPSMDFQDVSQIILLHLFKKYYLYDHSQPIENWVSKIISNQIANILRNAYLVLAPPCSRCAFNQGAGLCGWSRSGTQDSQCPLYSKWQKSKQAGYNMKLAESIDNADSEASFKVSEEQPINWPDQIGKFHAEMKFRLPPDLFKAYSLLYIENKTDTETAKAMGFKTTEKGRVPGYKQIYNLKKKIIEIAREIAKDFADENH